MLFLLCQCRSFSRDDCLPFALSCFTKERCIVRLKNDRPAEGPAFAGPSQPICAILLWATKDVRVAKGGRTVGLRCRARHRRAAGPEERTPSVNRRAISGIANVVPHCEAITVRGDRVNVVAEKLGCEAILT